MEDETKPVSDPNAEPAPATAAPPPAAPTFPGTYPKVFFYRGIDHFPPRVVRSAVEEALIDLEKWEQNPAGRRRTQRSGHRDMAETVLQHQLPTASSR